MLMFCKFFSVTLLALCCINTGFCSDNFIEGFKPNIRVTPFRVDPRVSHMVTENIPNTGMTGTNTNALEAASLGIFNWGTFPIKEEKKSKFYFIPIDGHLDLRGEKLKNKDIEILCNTTGFEAITILDIRDNKDITNQSLELIYNSNIGSIRDYSSYHKATSEISRVVIKTSGTSITKEVIDSFSKPKNNFKITYIKPGELILPDIIGVRYFLFDDE
jgi:hypothetical protein